MFCAYAFVIFDQDFFLVVALKETLTCSLILRAV
jgi:hypothetical protein